ncbi:hypothetical protein M899_2797 [Bacteriovorax sp. BSW11_IV]|uniref:hypothetical protein n=1 Tax=Bacteriovorax sp. BSW11_IV TaxID=1353529 RepID=UPI000389F6D5|nr:hypothetical protein [Bacteriovorax sp. BSW11_IV]EQC48198.1 hypothetical protein M899_2797 [Bacteriovorax sp. BSW11_IV]
MKIKLLKIIALLLLFSCGKEQFSVNRNVDQGSTPEKNNIGTYACANYTLVRPQVDLLFLWDNSSSQTYTRAEVKQALNKVIDYVSSRFDYHIMMAPLIGTGNTSSYFFSYNYFNPGSGIQVINKESASSYLGSFQTGGATKEAGVTRAVDLLATNQSNQVFRKNAYTIVVLMSNDDDNSYVSGDFGGTQNQDAYVRGKTHDLLCLRGAYSGSYHNDKSKYYANCSNATSLNSSMMRFISISALGTSSSCSATVGMFRSGTTYRAVSQNIYGATYDGNLANVPSDQSSRTMYYGEGNDAYDICRGEYAHIFDGVNNAITDTVLKHKYKYWPIAKTNENVDESEIIVKTNSGQEFLPITGATTVNGQEVTGYKFLGNVNLTRDTRYFPTSGEPYTGKMIELFGAAKDVVWPDCFKVTAKTPTLYYGYVALTQGKPAESTINLKINGQTISQSTVNGWQLIKSGSQPQFISNQNILVTSPTNSTPVVPGEYQSGYFLKLYGSAIMSSGSTYTIDYEPAGN